MVCMTRARAVAKKDRKTKASKARFLEELSRLRGSAVSPSGM
jgi:hypothetical protein